MARLTIALERRDHYALKLLAIRENKRMVAVVDDAIKFYLKATGAYGLKIAEDNATHSTLTNDPE